MLQIDFGIKTGFNRLDQSLCLSRSIFRTKNQNMCVYADDVKIIIAIKYLILFLFGHIRLSET